jgi:peptide-methionine (S)-S-oxide reductase
MRKILATLLLLFTAMNNAHAAKPDSKLAHAYFGGGCFWCVEAVFETMDGVSSVVSGFAGGKGKVTYHTLHGSGHAEVFRIDFDPSKVSYEQLLDLFWEAHDPTTLNRQGADTGSQYRSIILYTDDAQRVVAGKSRDTAQAGFHDPIVTEIVPLTEFHEADERHQDYFARNSENRYCQMVIKPKLEMLGR